VRPSGRLPAVQQGKYLINGQCKECASFYYLAPNGICQNCTISNSQACALTCHHCRDGYEWSPEHAHCETVQEGDYV
jgi:hypothetical protein